MSQVIYNIGGSFIFFVSFLGVFLTLFAKDRSGKIDIKYSILMIIWLVATTYANLKGVRFGLLLVPAFAVGVGLCLGILF